MEVSKYCIDSIENNLPRNKLHLLILSIYLQGEDVFQSNHNVTADYRNAYNDKLDFIINMFITCVIRLSACRVNKKSLLMGFIVVLSR